MYGTQVVSLIDQGLDFLGDKRDTYSVHVPIIFEKM